MKILEDLIKEQNKVLNAKKALYIAIMLLIIFFGLIVMGSIFNSLPNNNYKSTEIKGDINNIIEIDNNRYFKIDNSWYLIKSDFIDYINIGDYVVKKSNSYEFFVYDNDSLKFKGVEKSVKFEKVEKPS